MRESATVGSSRSMGDRLHPQHTVGRIFGSDWTIANVATLLRFNAGQGVLRSGHLTGGLREINENYLRRTSARHLPSGVTVTFRRDETSHWHAELCFADLDHYLPWNDALAQEWLAALFLQNRPHVRESTETTSQPNTVRHFKLPV